jgi:integrase
MPAHTLPPPCHGSLTGFASGRLHSQAAMKSRFWLCKRGTIYYALDSETGRRISLRTSDKLEAQKLLYAKNEVIGKPALGLALAKAYLSAFDPALAKRTWQDVLDEFCSRGQPQTQALRRRKTRHHAFDLIRHKGLVETTADDFRQVLKSSGVIVQAFLRCTHNLALDLGWLPWPILPRKLWPEPRFKEKRAITADEHQQIIAAEGNQERRSYYDLLWEIGASQTDAVLLTAENIDWENRVLAYSRKKTGTWAYIAIGPRLELLLRKLPAAGHLFPKLAATTENARSAEFWRRCKLLGITGVSLHSYRYAWAQRAKECGYPERFAQEALGHNSKAVHRAYARHARVLLPSIESFEKPAPHGCAIPFFGSQGHTAPHADGTQPNAAGQGPSATR